ncbi:MAG: hypothetical protein NTV06_07420, partial [candidate division Zixibacteria bacterium]|nr:hypothetical protein [candidate division Zixibacteria bacterium]
MKINHGLEFAVVWSLTRLIQLMPGRVADMLAAALGKLAYLVLTSRRRIARDNLKRGFGDQLQAEQ